MSDLLPASGDNSINPSDTVVKEVSDPPLILYAAVGDSEGGDKICWNTLEPGNSLKSSYAFL